MKVRATINDVARAAGVSKQTVSRAINDKPEISQTTKERILKIANEMGYRPSRLARAMNTQRTHLIGLVVPDIMNPFFPEVARGMQDAAFEHDYNVLLANSDDDPEIEIKTLETLAAQNVDGIVINSHQASGEALHQFCETFRPLVVINRFFEHPNVTQLIVDNELGARLAVDHFVKLGRVNITMLTNNNFNNNDVRRVRGYKSAVSKHGLTPDIVRNAATLQGGYDAMTKVLAETPAVNAIFAYNDLMGLGAIRACRDYGKRVPEDIAIIGFDDIQMASMHTPSLSTIHVDKYNLGRVAFQHIYALINEQGDTPTDTPTEEVGVKLILRESTPTI